MNLIRRFLFGLLIVPAVGDAAFANLSRLTALEAKWGTWSASGAHERFSQKTKIGMAISPSDDVELYRTYVKYDLRFLFKAPPGYGIVGAYLDFFPWRPALDEPLAVGVFEVTTPFPQLEDWQLTRPDIYDDLGSGLMYGSAELPNPHNEIRLSAFGVATINANLKGSLTIGLSALGGPGNSLANGLTGVGVPELVAEYARIPEPSATTLAVLAAAVSAKRRPRRTG